MTKRKVGPSYLIARSLPKVVWDKTLTNSARSEFLKCRKKFEWNYLRRLSTRMPNIPFLVGGLFHNGLECMYGTGTFNEEQTKKIVHAAVEKACNESSITAQQSDKIWKQSALIMGMLKGYAARYLKEDLAKWRIVSLEHTFQFKLPRGWIATGKKDMIVETKGKRKRLILVEHKTAGRLDANYITKLPLDAQIQHYALAEKKRTGKAPDEVVYNIAKKSQLRQRGNETFRDYCTRIEAEYVKNPSAYFYREVLTVSAKDLERYEEELLRFTLEIDRAIKEGYFYRNTNECTAMGVCPYMNLCISGPTKENLMRFRVRDSIHEELEEVEE